MSRGDVLHLVLSDYDISTVSNIILLKFALRLTIYATSLDSTQKIDKGVRDKMSARSQS